jgi:translation elongation factor EF-G
MTQDEGSYTLDLSHYEIVPDNVAQAVIAKSRDRDKEVGA